MNIIDLARKLGEEIQKDERYIKLKILAQNNDDDEELKKLINRFKFKQISLNEELNKSKKNEEKIKLLNDDLKSCYADIMKNKNMVIFNEAKSEFEQLIKRINAIIINSANGKDPLTTDLNVNSNCEGDCCSCDGCH